MFEFNSRRLQSLTATRFSPRRLRLAVEAAGYEINAKICFPQLNVENWVD